MAEAWQVDFKGRRYRKEGSALVYASADDRDAASEDNYLTRPCPRDCCQSILASISTHAEDLLQQYMQWVQRADVRDCYDSQVIAQWERERFGASLFPAAHGMICELVRVARFGEPRVRRAERQSAMEGVRDMPHEPRVLAVVEREVGEDG
jgi:hypothetical protein